MMIMQGRQVRIQTRQVHTYASTATIGWDVGTVTVKQGERECIGEEVESKPTETKEASVYSFPLIPSPGEKGRVYVKERDGQEKEKEQKDGHHE